MTHFQSTLGSRFPLVTIPLLPSATASCEGLEQEDVVGKGSALQARTRNGYQNRGGTYVRAGRH